MSEYRHVLMGHPAAGYVWRGAAKAGPAMLMLMPTCLPDLAHAFPGEKRCIAVGNQVCCKQQQPLQLQLLPKGLGTQCMHAA